MGFFSAGEPFLRGATDAGRAQLAHHRRRDRLVAGHRRCRVTQLRDRTGRIPVRGEAPAGARGERRPSSSRGGSATPVMRARRSLRAAGTRSRCAGGPSQSDPGLDWVRRSVPPRSAARVVAQHSSSKLDEPPEQPSGDSARALGHRAHPHRGSEPHFRIEDGTYLMLTQQMAAVSVQMPSRPILNVNARRDEVVAAIELLLQGF